MLRVVIGAVAGLGMAFAVVPPAPACTPRLWAGVENVSVSPGLLRVPSLMKLERDNVFFSTSLDFSQPLLRAGDEFKDFRPLVQGSRVATDERGEAAIKLDSPQCRSAAGQESVIFLFQSSGLTLSSCRKESQGNFACVSGGSAAFRNSCSNLIVETPSAQVQLEGTWVALTYLPERQLSLLQVYEGSTLARRVEDFDNQTLGAATRVSKGQFWFGMPPFVAGSVAGLSPGVSYPLTELPKLVEALDLQPWMNRILERAADDKLVERPPRADPWVAAGLLAVFAALVIADQTEEAPKPDLLIRSVELRDQATTGAGATLFFRLVAYNQGNAAARLREVRVESLSGRTPAALRAQSSLRGEAEVAARAALELTVAVHLPEGLGLPVRFTLVSPNDADPGNNSRVYRTGGVE